jgi:hypothetical protein
MQPANVGRLKGNDVVHMPLLASSFLEHLRLVIDLDYQKFIRFIRPAGNSAVFRCHVGFVLCAALCGIFLSPSFMGLREIVWVILGHFLINARATCTSGSSA